MKQRKQLQGKIAVVTGSTKGIGRAIAQAYVEAGAKVAIVSRNRIDCERVAAELQGDKIATAAFPCDVTRIEDFRNLIEAVSDLWGGLDILVNNAGSAITQRAIDLTEAEWDQVVNLDLKSVFFCSQAAARSMIPRRKGKIVNIASILGLVGAPGLLPYCAAKGGVVNMTRALAIEWARFGIQVNALCPGYVMTDINRDKLSDEKVMTSLLGKTPAGRLGEAGDITGAAVFLASEAADYMTGQALTVDGGWTAI